jgi:pimeloyl-ACP methyl ester carboxylesterase
MQSFEDIPAETIRSIAAPTLVVVGDRDVMRPEHAVETFRLLPHAQLAVLPGTEHMALTRRTEWLAPMMSEFLNDPSPKATA